MFNTDSTVRFTLNLICVSICTLQSSEITIPRIMDNVLVSSPLATLSFMP